MSLLRPSATLGVKVTLTKTYDTLDRLRRMKRDHIWGYVARNLARPVWLSKSDRRVDIVIGNPPWVSYRAMSRPMQDTFKREAQRARVFVGGKSATANDLCALFVARAAELYLKPTRRFAVVLPHAAMSRQPYEAFRRGVYGDMAGHQGPIIRFTEAWTFPAEVQPLFPVPAWVLFGVRVSAAEPLPATVRRFKGYLPRRDAHEAEAARPLTETQAPWPTDDGAARGSPYRTRFRQGATLVPRRLIVVEALPAQGGLGRNAAVPRVRGRVSAQDKKPWNRLDPLVGPVERQFLRPVLLGESIAPYRVLSRVTGVIPMTPGREKPMDSQAVLVRGFNDLSSWLLAAENLWKKHGSGRIAFGERLDFYGLLSSQFRVAPLRVGFAASGTNPAACVIDDGETVIEHAIYWAPVRSIEEGRYLAAIINSETTRARIAHLQSTGQWGARHFDTLVFSLPIPLFDPAIRLNGNLAAAAEAATEVAASATVAEREHFTRIPRRIRDSLAEAGIAAKIDALVARLLDG